MWCHNRCKFNKHENRRNNGDGRDDRNNRDNRDNRDNRQRPTKTKLPFNKNYQNHGSSRHKLSLDHIRYNINSEYSDRFKHEKHNDDGRGGHKFKNHNKNVHNHNQKISDKSSNHDRGE
ncbi:hypothetical protein AX774_g2700 [Zancudomyces culisetae]|nr:hypothetical protein AX774_g2700 [Zancudomyces culisetae]|eukprot:OMH83774.1 hypothetical protein AX774_g2700 [Zancudomyces culisetae]